MAHKIVEAEKEGHRKVKTDFRKKRLKKFKEKITGKFLRAFPENLKKDFQKHKQTENVKRLMTTGGAYKKRTPIKVVSESTPKKGTGKLGPSGQSGYKFYNKGGRAGFQGGGRIGFKAGTKGPSAGRPLGGVEKKKKIKTIKVGSGIKIGTVDYKNPEGLKDAKSVKGKPHSSPEGRFFSKMRTSPLVVKFNKGGRAGFKHGGSAGAAKRGHGAEIK